MSSLVTDRTRFVYGPMNLPTDMCKAIYTLTSSKGGLNNNGSLIIPENTGNKQEGQMALGLITWATSNNTLQMWFQLYGEILKYEYEKNIGNILQRHYFSNLISRPPQCLLQNRFCLKYCELLDERCQTK